MTHLGEVLRHLLRYTVLLNEIHVQVGMISACNGWFQVS